MNTLKKHRKEIIISLITGVFLFYVQPLLNILGSAFVRTFVLVSDKFSNVYYTSIALNDSNASSDLSNFLLTIIITFILFYMIFHLREKEKDLVKKISKILDQIPELKGRLNEPESEKGRSKEALLKEL